MRLKEAIEFWVSESGFRQIQDFLSKQVHGNSKYAAANLLWNNYNIGYIQDAIETLREAMEPAEKMETYYRGSPSQITNTHRREGFFSLAHTPEKAATYGTVYTVRVKPGVPRLKIPFEGGEVLLHDGMMYDYKDRTITVSVPKATNTIPFLGNLYTRRKRMEEMKMKEKINRIIGYLWCYLHLTPNEFGIYEEECDLGLLGDFGKLPDAEKLAKIREILPTYENKDALFSEISMMLNTPESTIRELVGGRKRRSSQRKSRHRSRLTRRRVRRTSG